MEDSSIYNIFLKIKHEFLFDEWAENSLKNGGDELLLTKNDLNELYSLFILKSLCSEFWIEKQHDFMYVSLDVAIQNFLKMEQNFWVYYYFKELPEKDSLRKIIYKAFLTMIYQEIVFQKNEKIEKKTIISVSLGFFNPAWSLTDKINISNEPYEIKQVGDSLFLFSNFFNKTVEIFRENIYSGKKILLKDQIFIDKLTKRYMILDEEDYFDIKKIYEKRNKNLNNAEGEMRSILFEISQIQKKKLELFSLKSDEYRFFAEDQVREVFKTFDSYPINNKTILLFAYKKIIESALKKKFNNTSSEILDASMAFLVRWIKIDELPKPKWIDKFMKILEFKLLKFLEPIDEKIKKDIIENKIESLEELDLGELAAKSDMDLGLVDELVNKNMKYLIEIFKKSNYFAQLRTNYKNSLEKIYKLDVEWKDKQQKLSFLFNLYIFKIIEDLKIFNKKIYFPFFFDFRGRLYFESLFSITNFKPSRYFFNYGEYDKNEMGDLELLIHPKIDTVANNFNSIINDVKIKFRINKNNRVINHAVLWVMIALGKEKIEKKKENYTIEEILNAGLKWINDPTEEKDVEKEVIYLHYCKILSSLTKNIIKKRFIHKDATASFIQNSIRLLGAKNLKALEKANLLSVENWFDTYMLSINNWKKKLEIKNQKIEVNNKGKKVYISHLLLDYFTRKNIKPVLMTTPYAASFPKKWEYFCDAIFKDSGTDERFNKDLLFIFSDFNSYIDSKFWTDEFLETDNYSLVEKILQQINRNKKAVIFSSDSSTDIIYYKIKVKKIDIVFPIKNADIKIRRIKNFNVIDFENVWTEKIKRSVRANWVHFSDASLVRQINNNFKSPFISIHDCFLIDPLSVSLFIEKANEAFKNVNVISQTKNTKLLNEIYSIFIFI